MSALFCRNEFKMCVVNLCEFLTHTNTTFISSTSKQEKQVTSIILNKIGDEELTLSSKQTFC